jgi:4-carboxymuconolactone decarboxylase
MPDRPVRIAPLNPSEFTPEAREVLGVLIGPEKAAIFHMPRTFARHPQLIRALLEFNSDVQQSAGISPRLREIIIMRVAWLNRNGYIWAQHNQMMRGLNMGEEYIEAIKAGADDPAWSAEERPVLRVADELIRTCELTDPAWKELVEHYSTNQILDILALLGQHSMMAIVFNAIGLRSEPQFKEFALDGS